MRYLRTTFNQLTTDRFNMDVMWNLASLIILAVGGIIINSVILALRGLDALGIFNQVFAFYIVLSQIGVGGLQFSTLKHISYVQDDREACADITLSAILLVTLLTLPLCLIAWILVDPIVTTFMDKPDTGIGLKMAIPGLLFFALNKVLVNVLNGVGDMRAYAVFRAGRYLLLPFFIVCIILYGAPSAYLALALTLTEIVLMGCLLVYIYRGILPLRRLQNGAEHIRNHVSYGLRGVMSGVLTELNTRVDVLMLSAFTTDAMVGLYSFAAILAEGFAQLPVAIRNNVDPVMGRAFASGNRDELTTLSQRIKRTFIPILTALGMVSIVAYPVVFIVLSNEGDGRMSWIVYIILAVAIMISAVYRPFQGLFLQAGAPALHTAFVMGLVLLNIVLNLLLIPIWGLYGAALGTGIMFITESVGLWFFARRLYGIHL
jgi:O-antigen/teichoic acid export membrane protein